MRLLLRVLVSVLCLWQTSIANLISSTEIAQFAQQHFDSLTERTTIPLHYQLALANPQPIQGPVWKETPQGIYLEEPRNFEIPVKSSIQVGPVHLALHQKTTKGDKKSTVKPKLAKKKKKHQKPHNNDEKETSVKKSPDVILSEDIKYLKDDEIPEQRQKKKKIKKGYADKPIFLVKETQQIEQVKEPEERINEEFHKIDPQPHLPREHKKEQQYLLETTNNEGTTFKTPIDDAYEKLSQEGIQFVQSNIFGKQPQDTTPEPQTVYARHEFAGEIKDLNSNVGEIQQQSGKNEVKLYGHSGLEESHKNYDSKGNKYENFGLEEHDSKHTESDEGNYDDKKDVESKKVRSKVKERYQDRYKDKGRKKKKHDHEEGHVEKHGIFEKGQKKEKFEEKEGHKKGHKTKGYHNKFHKDEVHREHKFYDDDKDQHYHHKKEDAVVNKVVGNDARILQGLHNRRQSIPVYENNGQSNRNNVRVVNKNQDKLIRIKHVNNQGRGVGNKKYYGPVRTGPAPPTQTGTFPPGRKYYTIYNKGKR